MTSDIGIVLCSSVDWDAPWERLHQLAWMFGEERPVLFVEHTGLHTFRLDQLSRVAARFIDALRHRENDNEQHPLLARENPRGVTCIAPRQLPSSGDQYSAKINNRLFTDQVKKAMGRVGMKRAILWAGSPTEQVVSLLNARPWELIVYDCIADFPELYPYQSAKLLAAETALMRRADVALAVSHLLEHKLLRYGRPIVQHMPNGLGLDRFARPSSLPLELANLHRPIIGYLGAMRENVFDMTLVAGMAKSHREWSLLLAGPIDRELMGRIDDAPLHLAGQVPYDDVPGWLRACDVGIIPYIESAATRAMNPHKIYEYLACGLPVISSPLPELDVFGDLVIQAAGPDRFSFAVHAALEEGRQRAAQRQQAAAPHNWDRRFAQITSLLDNALKARAAR